MYSNYEYKITKSNRKSYSISIDSLGIVQLKVPNFLTKIEIESLLNKHNNWIETKLAARLKANSINNLEKLVNYSEVMLLGKRIEVVLDGKTIGADLQDNRLIINETFKPKLANFINLWFKKYAANYFNRATTDLASLHNFKFQKIKLSSARKRWGSCSSKGYINLAWRLIMAKESVINSVILHELVHTVHMNHSDKFYQLLDSVDSNRLNSDKWLNENSYLLNLY
ncbi:SprT family zinc-dependent metalloprotease [Candidatus Kapabacteria bacterium]|nr:SprT family zinc-dependent metalloprotease [Candidatus Kapabacteria bacterium]